MERLLSCEKGTKSHDGVFIESIHPVDDLSELFKGENSVDQICKLVTTDSTIVKEQLLELRVNSVLYEWNG